MANGLNVTRIISPTSDSATMKAPACQTLTWPEGIGRERVRATSASMRWSVMSFQVQPAPRITKAPMAKAANSQRSIQRQPSAMIASVSPHQQGISKSQVPIGRSARISRR